MQSENNNGNQKSSSFIKPSLPSAESVLNEFRSSSLAAKLTPSTNEGAAPQSKQITLIANSVDGSSKCITAAAEEGRKCLGEKNVKCAFLLLAGAAKGYQSQQKPDVKLSGTMIFVYTELAEMYRLGIGTRADHTKAFDYARKAGDLGSAEMSYAAGLLGEISGEKDKKLDKESRMTIITRLYKNSAELGYLPAQKRLGSLYIQNGKYDEAFEFLSESFRGGNVEAADELADMYYQGLGTKKNIGKAVELYRTAADNSIYSAACKVGRILGEGTEYPKDIPAAEKYLRLATDNGIGEAEICLAELYCNENRRDDAWKIADSQSFLDHIGKPSEKLLNVIYELAWEHYDDPDSEERVCALLKIAADEHYKDSEYLLGRKYYKGTESRRNHQLAAELLERSLMRSCCADKAAEIKYDLGVMYFNGGYGLEPDHVLAYDFFTESVSGDGTSEFMAAKICFKGEHGAEKNFSEAVKLLKIAYMRSCEGLRGEAAFMIGEIFREGDKTIQPSLQESFSWYKRAVECGNRKAMAALGRFYFKGEGVDQDYRKALDLFKRSGEALAEKQLAEAYCLYYGIEAEKNEALAFETVSQFDLSELGNEFIRILYEWSSSERAEGDTLRKIAEYALKLIETGETPSEQMIRQISECAQSLSGDNSKDGIALRGDCLCCLADSNEDSRRELLETAKKSGGEPELGEKVFKWYKKLADLGVAEAYGELGRCFAAGVGTKSDHQKALEYYLKGAESGDASVQFTLAECYQNGKGCRKDHEKAYEWFCRSAESQYTEAAEKLLELGKLCEADDSALAVKCFRKAFEHGITEAGELYIITDYRNIVSAKMDPEEKWKALSELCAQFKKAPSDEKLREAYDLCQADKCLTALCEERHRQTRSNEEGSIFFPKWSSPKYFSQTDADKMYRTAYDLERYGRTEQAILAYYIAAEKGDRNALAAIFNMGIRNTLYYIDMKHKKKGDRIDDE